MTHHLHELQPAHKMIGWLRETSLTFLLDRSPLAKPYVGNGWGVAEHILSTNRYAMLFVWQWAEVRQR